MLDGGAGCPLFLRVVSLWTLLALLLCSSQGTFSPTWHRLIIWHLGCIFGHGLFAPMALVAILVLAVFLLLHSGSGIMLKSTVCFNSLQQKQHFLFGIMLMLLKSLEAISFILGYFFQIFDCRNAPSSSGIYFFYFYFSC